ncbi:MAG: flavodoxin family protein [Syntrophobacteraceae bacterium]
MLLLAIYGSPRKDGNTDLMMDSFLDGALSASSVELQKIYARDLGISGCRSCGYCDEHGVCVQQDDMQKVYPFFDTAERIVIASPIFFYGLSGQAKLLVDRSQASFMRKYKSKTQGHALTTSGQRKGFFLCAGATRGKRLFDCPILTVKYFFDAIDVEYAGEVCFREIDQKGAILSHPTALEECRQAGIAFVADGS